MVCSGMLTSTMSGPLGESCGFHQYSPGLSGPVGFPVGVPLGMKRRLFDRLRGGEQGDGESEDFQKFHQMITNVNRDESRKLPHPQGDFRPPASLLPTISRKY